MPWMAHPCRATDKCWIRVLPALLITSAAAPLISLTERPIDHWADAFSRSRRCAALLHFHRKGELMRRFVFHCVLFMILMTDSLTISSHSVALFAQSVASGTIEGTVVDSTGAVVIGAMVELRNPITGFQQTAVTDSMGAFRFTNIP